MAKFRLLIPLLFLLLLSLFLVACNDQPEITLDPLPLVSSTLPDTTTEPPVSSTVAETTEDPYLPGTPGLEFDERSDGTALVVGIVDVTAKEIRIPNYTPNGVRVIGIAHNAFSMNQTIETLILSKSVFSIEGGAFYGCTSLREIKFAEGLESIAPTAFQDCTSLVSLSLPASLTDLSSMAFAGCTSLNTLTVSEKNLAYYAEGNCLFLKTSRALVLGCVGSVIPENTVKIDNFAFYGMGISTLSLPNSIRAIGDHAFAFNRELVSVTLPTSLESLGSFAFSECTSLESISLPASLESIGKTPFKNCENMKSFTVSSENESYYAEGLCLVRRADETLIQGFVGAKIPETVRVIGENAFAYLMLRTVVIPEGVCVIEASAFAYCDALSSVTLPESLTSIASNAFFKSSALKTVTYGGDRESFDLLIEGVTLPEDVTVTCAK